jgi:hypothetical protein
LESFQLESFQLELSQLELSQLELLQLELLQLELFRLESFELESFRLTTVGAVFFPSLAMAGPATISKAASASIAASNTIFLKLFSFSFRIVASDSKR